MNGEIMTTAGAIVTLVALFANRIFQEQNLRLWTDREKLEWVELFSIFRIAATCIPVTIAVLCIGYAFFLHSTRGWAIVVAAISILLFALICQYFQLRRFAYYRFSATFIRRAAWTAAVTQAGLVVGISLIAFGLTSRIL